MSNSTGGPAFPVSTEYGSKIDSAEGMTLRDYFAAKVMQARLTRQPDPLPAPQWFQRGHEDIDARSCYVIADAMLLERAK